MDGVLYQRQQPVKCPVELHTFEEFCTVLMSIGQVKITDETLQSLVSLKGIANVHVFWRHVYCNRFACTHGVVHALVCMHTNTHYKQKIRFIFKYLNINRFAHTHTHTHIRACTNTINRTSE